MVQPPYYLDYAAATPLDERVFAAMKPYFTDFFYNPSSPYLPAVEVRQAYHAAKEQIAHSIGAHADECVMTAGATESVNLAIGGFSGHKICSEIEHDSVRQAITRGPHTFVGVDQNGRVDPSAIVAALTSETELVSVALANHEIGTIQPIREIAAALQIVREQRIRDANTTPLVLHCDASQGFGLIDVHTARLDVDMLTLNAAKIYGPKQVGLLWLRPGVTITANIVGGGQEQGLRSGTENVAGVMGYSEAVALAEAKRSSEVKRLGALRDDLERRISAECKSVVFSGSRKHRLANFSHVSFPGIDAERLVFKLEADGVLVATGSACAANKGTRSHVLEAIGLEPFVADGSIRMTLGRWTDEATIDTVVALLATAVRQEAQRTGVSL